MISTPSPGTPGREWGEGLVPQERSVGKAEEEPSPTRAYPEEGDSRRSANTERYLAFISAEAPLLHRGIDPYNPASQPSNERIGP